MNSIDQMLETLNLSASEEDQPIETKPIGFHLPLDYKEKYDLVQKRSKKKFGKLMKQFIIQSLDKIELESAS